LSEIERLEGIIEVTDEWTGSDTIDGLLKIGGKVICGGRSSSSYGWFKRHNGKYVSIVVSEPE